MNTANRLAHLAKESFNNLDGYESKNNILDVINSNSIKHSEYIKYECEKLAKQGYGSVRVKLDRTFDLFNFIENEDVAYSAGLVVEFLRNDGFIWKNEIVDNYDLFSDVLIWCNSLDQAIESLPMYQRKK